MYGVTSPRSRNSVPMLPLVIASVIAVGRMNPITIEVAHGSRRQPSAIPNGSISTSMYQSRCSGRYARSLSERASHGNGVRMNVAALRATKRIACQGVRTIFDAAGVAGFM